jgi:hypothetical protein
VVALAGVAIGETPRAFEHHTVHNTSLLSTESTYGDAGAVPTRPTRPAGNLQISSDATVSAGAIATVAVRCGCDQAKEAAERYSARPSRLARPRMLNATMRSDRHGNAQLPDCGERGRAVWDVDRARTAHDALSLHE